MKRWPVEWFNQEDFDSTIIDHCCWIVHNKLPFFLNEWSDVVFSLLLEGAELSP